MTLTIERRFRESQDTLAIYSLILEKELGFFYKLLRLLSPRRRECFRLFLKQFRWEIQTASSFLEWYWANQEEDLWQGLKKSLDRAEGLYKEAGGK